ncbi:hypothetical protein BpHYR1_032873 [Brachionus plicatilis]|uniref:Uncharacterized protein n=1 Tax=Brachionus plicatilis TaxID=10195 RepID=A0A3M7P6Y7_BRAPC|nr:hypothetical protein BpHYR1_032873 [Brachionus plicatilis]
MKFTLLAVFAALATIASIECNSLFKSINNDQLQQALSSLSLNQIPDYFKQPRDNSNWCCKVDVPILTLEKTRVVSYQITNSQNVKCGSSSCGFLGLFKCTRWCTQYWTETRYLTEHYPVTQQQACPTGQEICCQDYFFIMDHCFHITEVQQNLELLTALNNQGIVIPVGK